MVPLRLKESDPENWLLPMQEAPCPERWREAVTAEAKDRCMSFHPHEEPAIEPC